MNTNAPKQQISRILEKALDLRSFVSNQYLISKLEFLDGKYLSIPFKAFNAIPEFITMRVEIEDVVISAQLLNNIYFTPEYVFLPYVICPHLLILKKLNKIGNQNDIIDYIKSLTGLDSPSLFTLEDDIVVQFSSNQECMAFWRAIKYYPFKETNYIKAEIFSELYNNIPLNHLLNPANNLQTQNSTPRRTEANKQQQQRDYHNDDGPHSSSQDYQQRKSPRQQNHRNSPKHKTYVDGGSQKSSQSYRGNKTNRGQFFSKNQQPRQQPNPMQQNISQQSARHTPSVQRSRSQPLELQHDQQKPQIQFKSQQQPKPLWPQTSQSPQTHTKNYRQLQQQQPSTPQLHQSNQQQQILMQQQTSTQQQASTQQLQQTSLKQQQSSTQAQPNQGQQRQQPQQQQPPPQQQHQQQVPAQSPQPLKPKKRYYQPKKQIPHK